MNQMQFAKVVIALISLIVVYYAHVNVAYGDDALWRHVYGGVAIISLGLIGLSFTNRRFDKYLAILVGGFAVVILVAQQLRSWGFF